jgi:aquaporin Z
MKKKSIDLIRATRHTMNDVNNANHLKFRIKFFIAEFAGTALLLLGGLSVIIFMFGSGSPMVNLIPSLKIRQIITGFLFGTTGASIALSPIGKVSGAHINPIVTMVFWLFRKLQGRLVITYISAQLIGAMVGCLPLLLWGAMGRSIDYGATIPGKGYTMPEVLMGEVITSFALVMGLLIFIGFRKIRSLTPFLFPVLYAILVPLEADISGTSTNPARSLGPAIISGRWDAFWIYIIGPLVGALLASFAGSFLAKRITIAKLYHFDSESEGDYLLRDPAVRKKEKGK